MKMKILIFGTVCVIFLLSFNVVSVSIPKKPGSFLNNNCGKNSIHKTAEIPHLEPGDLMFLYTDIWDPTEENLGHALLFKEYNSKYDRYDFIEAYGTIRINYFFPWELEQDIWIYARVKSANHTQKQNAIKFAESQIGKQFQFPYHNKSYDPYDEKDPYSNKWYCSELVWAAYYNCNGTIGAGIDIDFDGWNVLEGDKYATVMPEDILADDDVEQFGSTVNKRKNYVKIITLNLFFKFLFLMKNYTF
jgi:hypothetical protein